MDLHRLRLSLLKLCVPALVASTWVFASFILQTRPEHSEHDEGQADTLTSLARLPASLEAELPGKIPGVFAPPVKAADPVRMDILRVGCWDRQGLPTEKVNARWVRLIGHPCQGDFSVDMVKVRNLTNGYVATVFAPATHSLTTDFIPLEPGANEILLRFEAGPGVAFENQLTLKR